MSAASPPSADLPQAVAGADPQGSVSPAGGGTVGCALPVTPGTTTQAIVVNGVRRTYLQIVPAGLDPRAPAPVIMGFHGGNDTAENANAYMGLTSSEPYLYVYPQAGPFADARAGWNVDPNGADFPFVEALLTDVGNRHCVDPSRVFAAGKSNGAFFVNSLLCLRPDLLEAAASVGGGAPQYKCSQPRAFMGIHGTADFSVPITTGRQGLNYWLAANKYADAPPQPGDPPPCVSYPGALNPVVWCEHGEGHMWPSWAGAAIRKFFNVAGPPPQVGGPTPPPSIPTPPSGDRTPPRATALALGARRLGLRISEPAGVAVQVFRCRTMPSRPGRARRVTCARVRPSIRRRGACRAISGNIGFRATRPGPLATSLCRALPAGRYLVRVIAWDPAGNRRRVQEVRTIAPR